MLFVYFRIYGSFYQNFSHSLMSGYAEPDVACAGYGNIVFIHFDLVMCRIRLACVRRGARSDGGCVPTRLC